MPRPVAAIIAALIAPAVLLAPDAASAAPKVAIFPVEVPDVIREGEFLPRPNKDDAPRIALATAELRRLLAETQRFEVIDLAPLATELKAAQPLHKCNGCDIDLARKAGADVVVTALVEKASDVLLNMSIEMKDVPSGKLMRIGGTVIQGNTDEMWLRSVRWIAKNRLFNEDTAK